MMPDLRKQHREADLAVQRGSWWRRQVCALLAKHAQGTQGFRQGRELVREERQQRVAAYHLLRGLDHTLQAVGSGLKHFAPGKAPSALGPEERRYRVPLPPEQQLTEGAFRFCIEDTENKTTLRGAGVRRGWRSAMLGVVL